MNRSDQRRRVLFMAGSMLGGGSERQTLLFLRHLDRDHFEPHLYLTYRRGELLSQLPDDVRVHSLEDLPPPRSLYFPGRIWRHQIAALKQLLIRESIEVIYDRTFHMTLIAGPAARSLAIPRVSTIVSPPDQMLPMMESRFLRLKRLQLARAYRQSARVIAVSTQAAQSAERYYRLPQGSTEVIPNPVDLAGLRSAAKLHAPPPRDDRLTLVCVGRMSEEKGHRDLLDALELTESQWPPSVAPAQVWLIGDGPLRGELEARWHSRSHLHQVAFLGAVMNPEPAIAAADALVLPSRFEGMPNAVLEAMALETPVIATRAGGTSELQRETPTAFWAEPSQPPTLAEAILRFVSSPVESKAHVEAAAAMIARYHDASQTTRQIERLLAGLDWRR